MANIGTRNLQQICVGNLVGNMVYQSFEQSSWNFFNIYFLLHRPRLVRLYRISNINIWVPNTRSKTKIHRIRSFIYFQFGGMMKRLALHPWEI